MTIQERKDILELKNTLNKIKNKQKVFFNVALFQDLGLIKITNNYSVDAFGNKYSSSKNFFLTEKAKKYLNIQF